MWFDMTKAFIYTMYTLKYMYMIRIKRNDIIFRDYKNKLHLITYNDKYNKSRYHLQY